VLKKRMSGKGGVVRLDHRGAEVRGRVDAKVELALLAIIAGEALEEERAKARTGTTSDRVEDEETLKTGALVSQLADTIKSSLDHLLASGVMTTGIVVGSILGSSDELFRVEEFAVLTSTDFIDDRRLEININGTRDILAGASFVEEGAERLAGLGL
jgi:hypothetical protein